MSDHEFERQVRQKLNNLKLTPSEETWRNIEEKLRERRRRRVPLYWLPLLVAGLALGGYWIMQPSKNNTGRHTAVAPQIADRSGSETGSQHPAPATKTDQQNTVRPGSVSADKQLSTLPRSVPALSAGPATAAQAEKRMGKSHSLVVPKHTVAPQASTAISNTEPLYSSPGVLPAKNDGVAGKFSHAQAALMVKPEAGLLHNRALKIPGVQLPEWQRAKVLAPVRLTAVSSASQQSSTPAITKPAREKQVASKWSYALVASGGVSAVNDGGLLSLNKPKVEDIAYNSSFAGTVVNYAPTYKPSRISPGLNFTLGAEVKRKLSDRFSIAAGINYNQINTHSKVGERVNSSNVVNNGVRGFLFVQSYYLLDQNENSEYRNKYHFVEIPVTLHTRINNSAKLPVYWNAGLVVSRLLSSTSLHFDGTTGVYYKNDRLLNQTQAGLTTGFSAALFNKTAHPLWIGPFARSNISTILKKDISASKHFVMLGLDVKWTLKK